MLFNSLEFLVLFCSTFILYYLPPVKKMQVYVLIISSLVFYAVENPYLLFLLLISIVLNSFISYAILFLATNQKKVVAVLGVSINLAIIVFFKYSGLLVTSLELQNSSIGHFFVSLPLPLGISFFTFEGISLVVDCFKEKDSSEIIKVKNFRQHLSKTFLFVSFFPHLIAGPILKANEFFPQVGQKLFKDINWDLGFKQLVVGFFLKVVIADNLKDQTFSMAYPYFLTLSSDNLLMMLFGYSIQIFADFAGYSLIALGLATLLGYELKKNFDFPYISTSFSEFWRRWHISLSSFLREYLYIPLGGNRQGKMRTYLNLFITMFLGGLWHGAAWSYAIWGTLHGIFLALERLKNDLFKEKQLLPDFLSWLLVFICVTFAWLLFKLPELEHVKYYLVSISKNTNEISNLKINWTILVYSTPIIIYHLYARFESKMKFKTQYNWVLYGVMLFLILTNKGTKSDFIYFQF